MRRIVSTAGRAAPVVEHVDPDLTSHQPAAGAVCRNEGAARHRLQRAIGVADLEKHHLAPIAQLQTEPVPANVAWAKSAGAPLVVEPAFARHAHWLAIC